MPVEGRVTLENVRIVFRNFEGREGPYNRAGDRSFSVLIDDALANEMLQDGWNIKWLKDRETGEPSQARLDVAVSYKKRPPTVVMITSRNRSNLSEDEIDILDQVDIANVDMIVNPSKWTMMNPRTREEESGIKAYLQSIYVTIHEDELAIKYGDIPMRNGRVDEG